VHDYTAVYLLRILLEPRHHIHTSFPPVIIIIPIIPRQSSALGHFTLLPQ
jgi:hypothetical protein